VFKAAVDRYWGIANAQQAPTPPSPAAAPPASPAAAPPASPAAALAPQTFEQWLKAASDRALLEYVTAQLGPGDPAWSSTGSTLRDELWKLSTSAVQNAAKAATAQQNKAATAQQNKAPTAQQNKAPTAQQNKAATAQQKKK
jgi:hypothetical protein